MIRLIRFYTLVFALVLGGLVGILASERGNTRPDYWMIFAMGDNTGWANVYRIIPQDGKITRLMYNSSTYLSVVATDPAQRTMLVLTVDLDTFAQTPYYLNLAGRQQALPTALTNAPRVEYIGWSKHHQLLFFSQDNNRQIYEFGVVNPDNTLQYLTESPPPCSPSTPNAISYETDPEWSPDGEWIYYRVIYCNLDEATYRIRANGSDRQQILDWNAHLAWTEDGEWMIAYRYENDGYTIFRMRPNGSEQQKLTEKVYALAGVTDWVYLYHETNLFRMSLDGSTSENLVDNVNYSAGFILNGDWLYLTRYEEKRIQINRVNITHHTLEPLLPPQSYVYLQSVSPDNRWLVYSGYQGENGRDWLYLVATDGSSVKRITPNSNTLSDVFWMPGPDQPWHAERLAFGAILLGVVGFILRWRRSK